MSIVGAIKEKLNAFLTSGLSPQKMALTVALGGTIGILPVPWGATILCAAAAVLFKLNQGGIQVVNYLVYPLQLALYLPFYRLGGMILPAGSFSTLHAGGYHNNSAALFTHFGSGMLKGIVAWLLTAPFVMGILYAIFRVLFKRKFPPTAAA